MSHPLRRLAPGTAARYSQQASGSASAPPPSTMQNTPLAEMQPRGTEPPRDLRRLFCLSQAALGARIADQLVGLVEGLVVFEHPDGGEAEAPVSVALRVGQVV